MNWPFWSTRTSGNDDCESIEPLLSLYADGMASSDEKRRVEAHLPGCDGCRESLAWMQATRRALAGRPIAVPPANLHSRIAEAIAASSGAPVALRPVRSFRVRPAYAAAVSVAAAGAVLSYSLLHSPVEDAVKPQPKQTPTVASVPAAKTPAPALPHSVHVKPSRPQVATRTVPAANTGKSNAVKHVPVPAETAPVVIVPRERVATGLPIPASHPALSSVKPIRRVSAQHDKVASTNVVPVVKRPPFVPEKAAPKQSQEAPLVASRSKEPLHIPVDVAPPTVVVDPQPVRTASLESPSKSDNSLASVNAFAGQMRKASYAANSFTRREVSLGTTNAMHALDNEHFGSVDAIHTPTGLH